MDSSAKTIAPAETAAITTERWYREYYARVGADRDNLLRNPEVLFQSLAHDASVLLALRSIQPDPGTARVLDVGCASGGSLLPFMRLDFNSANLFGVDIREDEIVQGKMRYPTVQFQQGDAHYLKFSSNSFDIVFESTMFIHMTNEESSMRVATEMLRVTKPNGHLLLADWRYPKPWNSRDYKPLSQKRISKLFGVGRLSIVRGVFAGRLVPPVGRFLSKNLPPAYFLVRSLFPFLVGQVTTVLQKL